MTRTIIVFFAGNERGGAAAHITTLARTVMRFNRRDKIHFLALGKGPLQVAVQETGVQCRTLEAGTLSAIRALTARLRQDRRVLLHAHGPRMNILASIAARRADVPWTSTIHSHPLYDFLGSSLKSRIYPKLHMWSLEKAVGLFVVQPSLATALPVKTILDVPNALDIEPLTESRVAYQEIWRQKLGLSEEARFIGIAARFDPVKNIDVLLRAFSKLSTPNVHLLLAGDGVGRDALETQVRDLGLEKNVHFLGFLTEMTSFYAALQLHILPSKSEGTPFCVLEAGAYGTANIGSDIAGLRALLQDGRAGQLVPVGKAEPLADAIDHLLQSPTHRDQLVTSFQREVLPKFSPERMLEAYERGYTVLEEDILRSRQFTHSS